MSNSGLNVAKKAKNDEFYTRIEDVEEELCNYKEFLKGKVVYCPCDTTLSAFYQYFVNNFNQLQLKKLIISSIHGDTVIFNGETKTYIHERVDFLSESATAYYESADVVVTNPPFSLFRKFYDKLKACKKDFIILGSNIAFTKRNIFPDFMNNRCCWGFMKQKNLLFLVPDSYELLKGDKVIEGKKYANVSVAWYTSFPITRERKLELTANYDPGKYPKYENYDAINVNHLNDIPIDYDGIIGVPASFLNYYNPDEFKIIGIGLGKLGKEIGVKPAPSDCAVSLRNRTNVYYMKDGKIVVPFTRIFIQKIKK